MEDGQYCGEYSVPWRVFSIVEDIKYCGVASLLLGCSIEWRMFSTLEGYHHENVEVVQYCGGKHCRYDFHIALI